MGDEILPALTAEEWDNPYGAHMVGDVRAAMVDALDEVLEDHCVFVADRCSPGAETLAAEAHERLVQRARDAIAALLPPREGL